MHELRAAPSTLLKASAFVARWTLAALLGAWLLAGLAWGLLHLAIVPRIGEFRPQLEATASRVLGIAVRIDHISAYSTGLIPAFELSDVRLLDAQGREALRLPRVLVSLSPRSALALQFDQVYVDGPRLDVRRAADGRIYVAGLEMAGGPVDPKLMDRLFSQPELAVRHGTVVWTDEQRGLPPLELRDMDLVMRNTGRRHDFRMDATPPQAWGDRFGLVARFEQPFLSMRRGDWQSWSGQLFADFQRVNVSELDRYADLPVDLRQGHGALRSWVDIQRGRATHATADLALANVVVGLDEQLQPLALASVSGRLSGSYTPQELRFETRELAFATADGLQWPGGNLRFAQTAANASRPAHGELQADRLDLAALGQVASRLPLGAKLHGLLADHAPVGLVQTLKARWEGAPEAPSHYEAQGQVRGLALRSRPDPAPLRAGARPAVGIPGVEGATVDFTLTDKAGKAQLSVADGSLDFPGVFEEPRVPLRQFSGELAWQADGDKLRVELSQARFANADAEGEMRMRWETSDPAKSAAHSLFPGVLDLQGSLGRADGTRVYRYLPLALGPDVRAYVRDAVQAGEGTGVQFRVKGDLHHMPFTDPRTGDFRISANIRNGVFAYVPRRLQAASALPWPVLSQLSGELVFERNGMRVNNARGLVGGQGVQLGKAEATIATLDHAPVVEVQAEARGPLADMLVAVHTSPLAGMTQHALDAATATGNAELRLRLAVPLHHADSATLAGSVALAGNDVQLLPQTPRLSRVRGSVNFSETGFALANMQARLLGGDLRLDGGTLTPPGAASLPSAQASASVVVAISPGPTASTAPTAPAAATLPAMAFRAQGSISAEALAQEKDLGAVARAARFASGSTSYTANLRWTDGVPEFSLQSSLQGLALALPAPLGKAADASLPLQIDSALLRDPPTGSTGSTGRTVVRAPLRDRVSLELGRVVSVAYVRDLSAPVPRVLQGAIAVGQDASAATPLPASGVSARVHMPALDLAPWSEVATQLSSGGLKDLDPAADAPNDGALALRAYLPTRLSLRAGTLDAGGRRLHNLVAELRREDLNWSSELQADELEGNVQYRQAPGGAPGRVTARLARLTLGAGSTSDVESLLDDEPAAIPALDVVVEDLQLGGRKLGRLEIAATNRSSAGPGGPVREWRLNRLDITNPEAVFKATGNWTALNAQATGTGRSAPRRTVMNFQLDILNAGDLLGRFGMRDVVRRGKGTMAGQIAWVGSPLALDYPTLGGSFHVDVENGQFLKADPGLAKLLGVLSLQALPRRLTLDFRDVFSEGFGFDFFRGDVQIQQGVATTNNLQMKGVNAAVLMDGRADLARETQDIRVVVVPEINAGTASLIATAINPAVGLGTFLAQLVLRRPLIEATTQEFHVEGSWVDPRITRVPRRGLLEGAAGGTDASPAAPAQ